MRGLLMLPLAATFFFVFNMTAAYGQDTFETYEVRYETEVFEVMASLPSAGKISSIQVFPEYGSILLTLELDPEAEEGQLRIILPRNLIDSKSEEGVDSDFIVVVDGDPDAAYSEASATASQRELVIPLEQDASQIEIFGSQVLPELPLGLVLPLAISLIIGLIIAYNRVKL